MKKIILFLLVACLIIPCAVMLTACGGFSLKSLFNKKSNENKTDTVVIDNRIRTDFSYYETHSNLEGFSIEVPANGYYEIDIYSSYALKKDITRTLSVNGKVVLQSFSQGSADSRLFHCIISAKQGDILSLNRGETVPEPEYVFDNYVTINCISQTGKMFDAVIDLKTENYISNLYLTNYYYEGFSHELQFDGYYHVKAEIYYNGYQFNEPDTRYLKLNGDTIHERTIETGFYSAVTIIDCYITAKKGDILSLSNGIDLKYQYHLNISFIPYSV